MKNFFVFIAVYIISSFLAVSPVLAQRTASPSASPIATEEAVVTEQPARVDITQRTEESVGPLEKLIREKQINEVWPFNPIKQAIKNSVEDGVPANTIVLLLLLPIIATFIAATRQIVGVRGFGIFLPAALSVSFVALGPALGVFLFIVIVFISTVVRLVTRKLKLKLQYLPRMAMILWFVSFGILSILFIRPLNVSIFPVLVLTLLTEDFTRIQLGKSFGTALRLTSQTLILSFLSYLFLTHRPFQIFVLTNPELSLVSTLFINILLGRYTGLRFFEYLRFRKLLKNK